MELLIHSIIALSIYGGPLVPLMIGCTFGPKYIFNKAIMGLCVLHLIAWVPFSYTEFYTDHTEYYAMIFPFLTGILCLILVPLGITYNHLRPKNA
jgi:amino acid transporter